MKNLFILSVLFFVFSSFSSKDRCTDWQSYGPSGRESKVSVKICEYESSGSGYFTFKNDSTKGAKINYTLIFKNGKKLIGTTKIRANSETTPLTCFNCATKNSGVDSWTLTELAFEGEEGYW